MCACVDFAQVHIIWLRQRRDYFKNTDVFKEILQGNNIYDERIFIKLASTKIFPYIISVTLLIFLRDW